MSTQASKKLRVSTTETETTPARLVERLNKIVALNKHSREIEDRLLETGVLTYETDSNGYQYQKFHVKGTLLLVLEHCICVLRKKFSYVTCNMMEKEKGRSLNLVENCDSHDKVLDFMEKRARRTNVVLCHAELHEGQQEDLIRKLHNGVCDADAKVAGPSGDCFTYFGFDWKAGMTPFWAPQCIKLSTDNVDLWIQLINMEKKKARTNFAVVDFARNSICNSTITERDDRIKLTSTELHISPESGCTLRIEPGGVTCLRLRMDGLHSDDLIYVAGKPLKWKDEYIEVHVIVDAALKSAVFLADDELLRHYDYSSISQDIESIHISNYEDTADLFVSYGDMGEFIKDDRTFIMNIDFDGKFLDPLDESSYKFSLEKKLAETVRIKVME